VLQRIFELLVVVFLVITSPVWSVTFEYLDLHAVVVASLCMSVLVLTSTDDLPKIYQNPCLVLALVTL
jgi:hypothetical protein